MTLKNLQTYGIKKLDNCVFNPELEADLLLSYVLSNVRPARAGRPFLYAHPKKSITKKQETDFKKLVRRRRKGEPFAYIVKEAEFYGLRFKVTPDVLIPRPETELLVEEAISKIISREARIKEVVDVGTGSGAIIIALYYHLSKSVPRAILPNFTATDISPQALKIARQNARELLGAKHGIKFKKSDLLASVAPRPVEKDKWLVVANLPYLTDLEAKKSELKYEPQTALAGGKQGLELMEKLIVQFRQFALKKDTLILEIGAEQAAALKKIIKTQLPKARPRIKKDIASRDRLAIVSF